MNFLELTQQLRQECGVAGTGPTTVVAQVGQAKKLVDWINQAWLEIQGMQDAWDFMREPFSFNTVANTPDYTPDGAAGVGAGLADFRYWYKDTLRCYRADIGIADEQWLVEWEYQVFRNTYRFNVQVAGRPVVFAVKPNGKALMFGQIPGDTYTVVGEYQRRPTRLVADTDEPDISEHLQWAIIWKAMEYYGLFESAGEVVTRARQQFKAVIAQMEREQLEMVHLGNPMA